MWASWNAMDCKGTTRSTGLDSSALVLFPPHYALREDPNLQSYHESRCRYLIACVPVSGCKSYNVMTFSRDAEPFTGQKLYRGWFAVSNSWSLRH